MSKNTQHDDDEEEEQEESEPKLSEKEKTMERIRLLRANGVVFQSYDGISEPDYNILGGAKGGGLRSSGTFGRQ